MENSMVKEYTDKVMDKKEEVSGKKERESSGVMNESTYC
jgi:hypothetical protein